MIFRGTAADGTPYEVNTDKIGKNGVDEDMSCFDRITLLPLNIEKYESKDHPGYIEAIPGKGGRGFFHPIGKDGKPELTIYLNKNGCYAELFK